MSRTLLLDSSNKYLAVGICDDEKIIGRVFYDAYLRQSEVMVNEINNLMKQTNTDKSDLDSIVVGIGPGSYTGVRIAVTIAKTIAYALKLKVFAVSSLFLLKNPQKTSICLLNAKANRVYFAVYDGNKEIISPCIMTVEEATTFIDNNPDFELCGDAYLFGRESYQFDMLDELFKAKNKNNIVENIFVLNPLYLKNYYDNNDHLEIIKATKDMLDDIFKIEQECFIDAWSKEDLHYEIENNPINNFLVLLKNKKIIGFLNYLDMFDTATISQIAIVKDERRHGYGKLLLDNMEQKLCSKTHDFCEFVTLEARVSNEAGIAFYKKNGFEYVTCKKSYYKNGEDALYFIKRLGNYDNLSD